MDRKSVAILIFSILGMVIFPKQDNSTQEDSLKFLRRSLTAEEQLLMQEATTEQEHEMLLLKIQADRKKAAEELKKV